MNVFNEQVILFIVVVVIIILVSIQYTLNKILRVLNEMKDKRKY